MQRDMNATRPHRQLWLLSRTETGHLDTCLSWSMTDRCHIDRALAEVQGNLEASSLFS